MNRIQNSTSYLQSKKLIEVGLPTETADMVNAYGPAWSLAKLISLMPNEISYMSEGVDPSDEEAFYSAPCPCYCLRMNSDTVRYETWDSGEVKYRVYGKMLIDAVVDAVAWLVEEGWLQVMLEKEDNP